MRKLAIFFVAAILSLVLIVSACAKPEPAPTTAPAPAPAPAPTAAPKPSPSPAAAPMPWEKWPVEQIPAAWGWPAFFVANGASGFYPDAVAVAEVVKKYSPIKTQVVQIGTGVTGQTSLIKGEALFNNIDAAVVNSAYLGVREFDGTKPGLVLGVATADNANQNGMYVRTGSGIKTAYDLKGKRVAYPQNIPVWEVSTDAVLKAHGMTRSDVKVVPYTATTGLPALMRQNLVDMYIYTVAPGTAMTTEMTTTGDAYLLSIEPDKIDAAEAATGGLYPKASVPAGSFKGQDKEILCLSQFNMMNVRADLPESLVYTVTRILYEHIDEFRNMASTIGKRFVSAKGAATARNIKAAYHAGAIRYYKEVGAWGTDQDKVQQNFETTMKDNLAAWQKKQK